MSEQSTQGWLTVAQAMKQLERSEKTIRRMIERGDLRGQKVTTSTGQEWRIAADSVAQHSKQVTEGDGRVIDTLTDTNGNLQARDGQVKEEETEGDGLSQTGGDGRETEATGQVTELVLAHDERLQQLESRVAFLAGAGFEKMQANLTEAIRQSIADALQSTPTREDIGGLPSKQDMAQAVNEAVKEATDSITTNALAPLIEEIEAREQAHDAAMAGALAPILERLDALTKDNERLERLRDELAKQSELQERQLQEAEERGKRRRWWPFG